MLLHLYSWDFSPSYSKKRHIITINYILIFNARLADYDGLNMVSL